jgi:hypothetical protein
LPSSSFADHVSLIHAARAENVQRVNHMFAANHDPASICIDNGRKGPRLRWSERHTIPLKARTNCFCCCATVTACLLLGTFAYSAPDKPKDLAALQQKMGH